MMVCPYDASRLLLILQTDHSRIAGLLAAHWGNDQFAEPQPYSSMVLAAQEHDSGWWDWEIKPSAHDKVTHRIISEASNTWVKGFGWILYRRAIERVARAISTPRYFVSMHGEALLTKGMGLLPSMPDYTADPPSRNLSAQQKEMRAGMAADVAKKPEY